MSGTTRRAQFKVGDRVLVRKPPAAVAREKGYDGASRRLLPLCSSTVHEIYKVVSPSHVVLCDVDTRITHLEFAQPAATERLVGYNLADLEAPIELETPLVLGSKNGAADLFSRGTLKAQSATGLVLVASANGDEEWLDLSQVEHRWVNPGPGAQQALQDQPVV